MNFIFSTHYDFLIYYFWQLQVIFGFCREMVKVNGHIRFQNNYSRVHVQLSGNCMEWKDHTSQSGGQLSADVFVDSVEQKWHANLNITNLFAPVRQIVCAVVCFYCVLCDVGLPDSSSHDLMQLFEKILEIPVTWFKGRATGEVLV